jgi:hypothetical protein
VYQILGDREEFARVVKWLSHNLSFDKDVRVSVFETNIRALGGLISAHLLIEDAKANAEDGIGEPLVPEYDGKLLEIALDLGRRCGAHMTQFVEHAPPLNKKSPATSTWHHQRISELNRFNKGSCHR